MAQGSQETRPWFYNSSLYVIGDNLRLLSDTITQSLPLRLSTLVVKLLAISVCVYSIVKSRGSKLTDAARHHFNFMTAIVLCLLVSHIVWEHYLTALLPMLIYIAASKRHFSREALILAGLIFALAAWQNLILINLIRTYTSFDTVPELIAIGVLKSSPLILTLVFMWRYSREVLQSYSAPAWLPGTAND